MRLRFSADRRTLLWMFVFLPGLVVAQFARPEWVAYLSWLSFYFAIASTAIAHNHQHCPTFVGKRMNRFFAAWISIFYGYPVFGWIPTHNLNHHKFVNKPGDATITWRITNSHNVLVAVTYPFVSGYYQGAPIMEYVANARANKPALFREIIEQYATVIGGHAAAITVGIVLHGVSTGVYVWAFSMGLPALVALWTVILFNYEQHVHTDPWSRYNHSRNFVGGPLNFLLFNNGYHGAHHEQAGLHWSKLPELHASFADQVDPSLKQGNLWWYWFRQYALALIFPSLGSKQIGRAPFDPPPDVEALPAPSAQRTAATHP